MQGCAFTGAVGTYEGNYFAVWNFQADVFNGMDGTVVYINIVDFLHQSTSSPKYASITRLLCLISSGVPLAMQRPYSKT